MPDVAEQPARPPRTWGPMVGWTLGILAALGLAWFVGAVVVPARETHRVVREFRSRCSGGQGANDTKADVAIMQLGGVEDASRRLAFYLRLPRWAYDEDLRYYAFRLVASCGKPAIRLLENGLRSNSSTERMTAASGLWRIGPEAYESVPALEKMLSDPDPEVRRSAAEALKKIRGEEANP